MWRTFQVGVRRWSIWLLSLFCLFSAGAWADGEGGFAISQVSFQQQVITAYVEVLDQNGQSLSNLPVSGLSATLQGQPLQVTRVTPFAASGEGAAYLFLIDVSKSIRPNQFKQNQRFIEDWIDSLNPADRMALVTFGEYDRQVIDFTSDKGRLQSSLAALKPTDRETKLYVALKNAMSLSNRSNEGFPGRRVVLVLSDGFDEGSSVTKDELLSLLRQSHIPVYTVGSSHLRAPQRQQGLEALNQIAAASGGLFRDLSAGSLTAIDKDLKDAIRRVFVVTLTCGGCQPASQTYPLAISLKTGATLRAARFDLAVMAPPPLPPPPSPWWKRPWTEVALIALIIVLITLVVLKVLRREKVLSVKTETKELATGGFVLRKPERVESGPLPAGGIPLRFTTVAGKQPGREYRVRLLERVVVGRDKECNLALPEDTEVSGRHCELTLAGRAVELTDLKSTNGTLLNGARVVARQRLESGDLIRVGRTELRVSFEEPE
jgi:VWFA-related protein